MNKKMMQETFDKVARHLLTQGAPARIPGTRQCLYRHEGLKCAIGCLIPDEMYRTWMENNTVRELIDRAELAYPELLHHLGLDAEVDESDDTTKRHLWMLIDLQRLHDNEPPEEWSWGLVQLAAQFELNDAVVWEIKNGK